MRAIAGWIASVVLVMGCADQQHDPAPLQARVGQNCGVHYRRDVLGMAAETPSSADTGAFNGAEIVQYGQLMETSRDGIVINSHGREFYIPQASILSVEFGSNIVQKPELSERLPQKPVEHSHAGHAEDSHSHLGHGSRSSP